MRVEYKYFSRSGRVSKIEEGRTHGGGEEDGNG